jgi:hypothetical protein
MLSATTSARSNRHIFVPEDTGSPNDDLLKHISKLGSIARLDFERCSVAGEVIYTVEGDAMPISQQDDEARIGTLAYALKKLVHQNQASTNRPVKAVDPAPKGRAYGEVPRNSRTYKKYLKSLNKIDQELLNKAVLPKQGDRSQISAGKRRKPLSIKDARALLRAEEWTEIRNRARNKAWMQFEPEADSDSQKSAAVLELENQIAHLQEVVQPRTVLSARVLAEFIERKTGFSYQGGPIPQTVWKKLNSADAQRLNELNEYAASTREELYRGFETMDKLRARVRKDGNTGSSPSTPNTDSPGTTLSVLAEIRDPHPAEDAAEFVRCLNIICAAGDALSRQATASYFYDKIAACKENGGDVSEVLNDMGLLAMALQSLNPTVEVTEVEESDINCNQSDQSPASEADGGSDAESDSETENGSESEDDPGPVEVKSLFDQEVEDIIRLIGGGRRKAAWYDEPDDARKEEYLLDQYDEGGALVMMSSHERTIACGRIDPEFSAEDLPQCAQHLATKLRRDHANGVSSSEIRADIDAELSTLFPVSNEDDDGRPTFISHANGELQRFCREVLEAILDECREDFHLSASHNNPVYRSFHKAIRGTSDTRTVGNLMKRAYRARQSKWLTIKQFITLNTASKLQRERLLSASLSGTALQLIKEIRTASTCKLRYFAWAFYGDNQPSHPIHSLSEDEVSRIWEILKARRQQFAAPNRAA